MLKNLVIVESPTKAKTIKKFLGKDYQVESSYGHIRDLVEKNMGIDVEHDYTPEYVVPKDKKRIVNKLKKLTKDAKTVWLAPDEDREGEAIAWHLAEALNLNPDTTNRIVFHEITKGAIEKAIQNPRKIDLNLVNSQQARRILDRLVGYGLSPILWKKVQRGLSAGRVQSIAVRLIVEREKKIKAFEPKEYFRVTAEFSTKEEKKIKGELNEKFNNETQADEFLQKCKSHLFDVVNKEIRLAKKSSAPPFTTSTLQQEASRKLNFSVAQTMSVAQKLYEAGHITYMRTDSMNLSREAINDSKIEIIDSYGKKFSKPRSYTTKNKSAQEAHEAIRPTYIKHYSAGTDERQKKLYNMIWRRAIASQMSDAELERTTLKISTPDKKLNFIAKGEVIKFEGFLKVYLEGADDENVEEQSGILPSAEKGEILELKWITATQRFTKHLPHYAEASLVKKLEELGIGRPSTYAPIISAIQRRNYIEKSKLNGKERKYIQLYLAKGKLKKTELSEIIGADKNKLIPTYIGMVVNDFLVEHFKDVLDFHFTASVEEQFDNIARGQEEWSKMIDSFYQGFQPHLKDVEENSERAKRGQLLGQDPKTGKNVYAKIGKYGPTIQIGEATDEKKPRFASLMKSQHINDITLGEALKLFDLPRELGTFQGQEIQINVGPFGPYIRHHNTFRSLNPEEGDDPYSITVERAIELIREKQKADKNKYIAKFEDEKPVIEILSGRYGPYIKANRKNYKIPKGTNPKTLSREHCLAIIEEITSRKNAKHKIKK